MAQQLDTSVDRIGGTVAASSVVSVVAMMIGALGGGLASDRLRRRRVFVALSAVVFLGGSLQMVSVHSVAALLAGAGLMNLGLGVFSAVDQAVVLDVLPDRAEAGRFVAVITYAQQIPHAIAPLVASVVLGIGSGAAKNYGLLYSVGGVFTVLGGLIILLRVKGSR
jgi:MFS family permease